MAFPVLNQITITPATTGGGQPLPAGETEKSVTLGVRLDGDATHGPGNYQWTGTLPAGDNTVTRAALDTALGTTLAPGNYWLNGEQTDVLSGIDFSGTWSATEVGFSIPPVGVAPDAPSLAVS